MFSRSTLRSALSPSTPSHEAAPTGLAATLRRPAFLLVQAVVLLALLAGAVAWSATGKTVALAVDGNVREVGTRGSTVADVLSAAGLKKGEHDLLVPDAGTRVEDGDRVALRRGRPVKLVVDGQERTVWVTATSVDEALQQLGLGGEGMALSASRSRRIPLEGLSLDVRTPKTLTIEADGASRPFTSAAPTVGDALAEAGVAVGPADRVVPAPTEPLTNGLVINVGRVVSQRVVEEVAVPFGTEKRDDPNLAKGTTKQLQAGAPGRVRRTVDVVSVDGKVTERQVVSEERLAEPVARVLAVGTRAAAPAPAAAPSTPRQGTGNADSLNWAGLARCESGGNPRAVSSNGSYRGLYQFSLSTWRGVGGSGDPIDASPDEQTYRAKLLYNRSGAGQWPVCGKYLFS